MVWPVKISFRELRPGDEVVVLVLLDRALAAPLGQEGLCLELVMKLARKRAPRRRPAIKVVEVQPAAGSNPARIEAVAEQRPASTPPRDPDRVDAGTGRPQRGAQQPVAGYFWGSGRRWRATSSRRGRSADSAPRPQVFFLLRRGSRPRIMRRHRSS